MKCVLDSALEIGTVLQAKAKYSEWLANGDSIEVVGSEVSRIDAAGLQALASLFVSAREGSKTIKLVQPSQTLNDAIETLKLHSLFLE
ncbi:STAS domain-containing protein [Thaumasiovibrio subtropicus]|uniref:STAS domain-containing protein n=1 Tax=Thaumasiovibrio subtropicus TaxID=1891207 RepID=UPI000B35311E|nr:STAS domain-containing protein [Thaumasiovibrio subtropicus]